MTTDLQAARAIPMTDIRARFTGGNYRALAAQFRLSERQIRKIINGTRT